MENNTKTLVKSMGISVAAVILMYVLLDVIFGIQVADEDSLYVKAKGKIISTAKNLKNKIC